MYFPYIRSSGVYPQTSSSTIYPSSFIDRSSLNTHPTLPKHYSTAAVTSPVYPAPFSPRPQPITIVGKPNSTIPSNGTIPTHSISRGSVFYPPRSLSPDPRNRVFQASPPRITVNHPIQTSTHPVLISPPNYAPTIAPFRPVSPPATRYISNPTQSSVLTFNKLNERIDDVGRYIPEDVKLIIQRSEEVKADFRKKIDKECDDVRSCFLTIGR